MRLNEKRRLLGYIVVLCIGLLFGRVVTGQEKKITYIRVLSSYDMNINRMVEKAIPGFEAKYPNIKVKQTPYPYDQVHEKVISELVAKSSTYDVIYFAESFSAELMSMGYLQPLDEYIRDKSLVDPNLNLDDFFPAALTITTWQGKRYGFYLINDVILFWYNTEMFKNAGLDPKRPPETWEEYIEFGKRLCKDTNNDGRIDVWGIGSEFKQHCAVVSDEFTLRRANFGGLSYTTGDGEHPAFNDEAGVKALENMIKTLPASPPGSKNWTWDEAGTAFAMGQVAMVKTWPYYARMAENPESSKVVGKIAYGKVPAAEPGGRHISVASGTCFGVNRFSRHKKEAFLFCQYITSKPVQEAFSPSPTRRSVYTKERIEKDPISAAVLMNAVDIVPSCPRIPRGKEMIDYLAIALSKALAGDMEPREALNWAYQECDNFMRAE